MQAGGDGPPDTVLLLLALLLLLTLLLPRALLLPLAQCPRCAGSVPVCEKSPAKFRMYRRFAPFATGFREDLLRNAARGIC